MQSTAMLEISRCWAGLFKRAGRIATAQWCVAPDSILLRARSVGSQSSDDAGEQFYLLTRSSAVAGADLRSGGATVGRDTNTIRPTLVSF